MPRGQKRQHIAVNQITNYFSREKRQDSKRSFNKENEVSTEQLKKQLQLKRGLGEKTCTKVRQPLQEIGGASNASLNTGLKATSEHREQWSVFSDAVPRSDAHDKKALPPQKQEPSTQSKISQSSQGDIEESTHDTPKESKHDTPKESTRDKPEKEPSQEPKQESSQGSTGKKEDDSMRTVLFQLSDDEKEDEDPNKGFFDSEEDDYIVTKVRRPKRPVKPKVATQQKDVEEEEEEEEEEEDLVSQFSIPAPSPVFDEPLASFSADDFEEASASFPAIFTPSLPNDTYQDATSIEKQDSKLLDAEDSSSSKKDSLPATLPFTTEEQYEAHDALPVPRGRTLLEKLGLESQKPE